MSIAVRIARAFKARTTNILDRIEDPREMLAYLYQQQLQAFTKSKGAAARATASRTRVELQIRTLRQQQAELEVTARLAPGPEGDAAHSEVLRQKAEADRQLSDLAATYGKLRAEEEQLTAVSMRLEAKVAALRTRRDAVKAAYAGTAEAEAKVRYVRSEVFGWVGEPGLSCQQQRDLLTQLGCSITGMATARERIEELIQTIELEQAELKGGTRDSGQDDLAEQALSEEFEIDRLLANLEAKRRSLQAYEEEATTAYEQLAARAETLRAQQEAVQADDTPGEGQNNVC
jgi:phage shock protein A